jgi:superfamily I DNA and/or RNA helicase
MLDTQYRMHPDISAFPSKAFYGSKLKDGTMDNGGNVLAGLEPPQGSVFRNDATGQQRTVTFIHHTKPDFARAKSIVNEGEAAIIYQVVLQLLKENPVITFGHKSY